MCPIERIVLIVDGKCGRCPTRGLLYGSLHNRWAGQCYVVGINRSRKVIHVAINASRRCTLKSIAVATNAIHRYVGSCKWKLSGIVIKHHICIPGWVTSKAGIGLINVTGYAIVYIIGLRILMTSHTSKLSIVGWIGVAFVALHPCTPGVFHYIWESIVHHG